MKAKSNKQRFLHKIISIKYKAIKIGEYSQEYRLPIAVYKNLLLKLNDL